ncbi:MAG: hypothetical protein KF686_20515 [Ramlibacter sp.]|nr:hypothetical protein [Ramlibacter sp.]
MRRRSLLAISLLVSATAMGNVNAKDNLVLQEPFPGMAILYLIRSPGDVEALSILVDGVKVATLPESGYTVLLVNPGLRKLASATKSGPEPSLDLAAAEGDRRFFYVSGVHKKPMGDAAKALPLFGLWGLAIDGGLNQPSTATGTRTWKECDEQEARDLISIAKLVLPD